MIHYFFLDLRARECVNFFSLHELGSLFLVYSLYISLKEGLMRKKKKNLNKTYKKETSLA